MKDVVVSLATGFAVGGLFGLVRLPIPAPGTIAGIAGIVGIFIGYVCIKFVVH